MITLREVIRDTLDAAGFEVDTAAASAEALDRLATRRSYAAVIADCVLPDLPVLDWLAALRGAAPTTPLILSSGAISYELKSYAADFGAVAVLEKPFSGEQLVAAVREAIEGE